METQIIENTFFPSHDDGDHYDDDNDEERANTRKEKKRKRPRRKEPETSRLCSLSSILFLLLAIVSLFYFLFSSDSLSNFCRSHCHLFCSTATLYQDS